MNPEHARSAGSLPAAATHVAAALENPSVAVGASRSGQDGRAPSLFELPATPLPLGPTLIEASAGTGKTFTLAGLFLRLLLEHGLSHRDILIVTYTEAATEELRGRIRARIAEAHAAFAPDATPGDPLFAALRGRLAAADPDLRHACATLQAALTGFDETPIHTIHGFCQRVLRDRAFESASLFDVELVTDPRPLLDELVADWWRMTFAAPALTPASQPGAPSIGRQEQGLGHPSLAMLGAPLESHDAADLSSATALARTGFALAAGLSPDALRKLLRETQRHPGLRMLAAASASDLPALLTLLDATFTEAARVFVPARAELRAQFGDNADWATKDYAKDGAMDEAFASLDACFAGTAGAADFKVFARFTTAQLEQHTSKARKKNPHQPPRHRFFGLCAELAALQERLRGAWQLGFHAWAEAELRRRKLERKVQSFDDLLTRLDAALAGEGGAALAAVVRGSYAAALIDEFQDTDPVQWRIFRRLFGGADQRLFLIGDPKQAIYGFRGADVFTYLSAAAGVAASHAHTLGTNWRSESGLVAAVNGIFGQHRCPFVEREIQFHPVAAAERADREPLTEGGRRLAPLRLWFWADEEPLSKTKAEPQLAELTATEIVRLLSPAAEVRLGGRPVRPADLAVLVESHHQAELVADALRRRGVPSVQQTQSGVFASAEAEQLRTLLGAIAEPAKERLVRAALATDILGLEAAALDALAQDESAWAGWLERFRSWSDRWQVAGFLPMFRELMQARHVRRRWLALADGERRLTNLLHLAELLHAAAAERRLGMNGLRQHLAHRCAHAAEAGDEELLRLERDDNAVQLVTIHRSKGLEYPVVFCPFAFRTAEPAKGWRADELVLCHDPADRTAMLGDLGSRQREEHERLAAEERLAENVRLLYVALTRARNRCYFAWGDFTAVTTAPAWLFTPPAGLAQGAHPVEALAASGDGLTAGAKRAAVETLAENVKSICVASPPEPAATAWTPPAGSLTPLAPRQFTAHIPRDWRVASFSWLTSDRRSEAPDHDAETAAPAAPSEPPEPPEPGSIHAFPRGTEAGTCLHQIFERLDFTGALRDEAALEEDIAGALREHALDARAFTPAVTDLVRRTLAVPLDARRSMAPLTLNQIPANVRLNELEFCFPLRRFAPDDLRRVLARHGADLPAGFPRALERLQFNPVKGVLRGFIDLVFRHDGRWWLVDWKSNWLGPRAEAYAPAALAAEMAAHCYPLQYLLYTLALDRWLALRVPGHDYARAFGGVRYLFLRGLDPARPELGVFADRPSAELIRELGELLLEPGEGGAG